MTRQPIGQHLPTIVLVGRANVGKSTLFNTLIEQKKAIVSDIAGTTRTNNEGISIWRGKEIRIIDTGGFDNAQNEAFADQIIEQDGRALKEADIIIMVADLKVGVLPQEKDLARSLKKRYPHTPIFLVPNKADSKKIELNAGEKEWMSLGLGQPLPVSAANGRGIGDLLDILYTELRKQPIRPKKTKTEKKEEIKIALIGKPNVGKSSLFNKLIGQEKVIVSDIAHTTREPHDTTIEYTHESKKHTFTFIDTAGIRRKSKVAGVLEREGISRSIKTAEQSDIILLVLDGKESIASQDMQLGGLIERRSKSVIILINKWDLTEDNSDAFRNDVKKMVYAHLPHLDFAPILFVSGKTGYRVNQIFPLIVRIAQARHTEIPRNALGKFIEWTTKQHKPSRGKGTRQPKIIGLQQIHSNPPIFEMVIKYRTSIHRSYVNYIENRLREEYNFIGTPIVIKLTKMKK
ncbi:MAG TPA: ribosome biogenesis GTPase Der [Candidatus Magasanikbacteria bacterium]|nr:MAG: ribosome biogenesis GTPase Der [Candidatus Magasanikbacteria bacterium RIFOXYC2_FULL_39_8]HAT03694.1 ribosome biogenesis GTPase Der [Candidatus Magasanikbacteria bacterium]